MEKSYVSTFYGICFKIVSATMLDHNTLEAVYIYFDTATYDEIEKDKKVIFDMSLPFHGLAMLVGQSANFFYIWVFILTYEQA